MSKPDKTVRDRRDTDTEVDRTVQVIKRYHLVAPKPPLYDAVQEDPTGSWVRYDEVTALIAATPQARFISERIQSLCDDHVATAHTHTKEMANVAGVCVICDTLRAMLAESAPEGDKP